jgi:hypothetical protein
LYQNSRSSSTFLHSQQIGRNEWTFDCCQTSTYKLSINAACRSTRRDASGCPGALEQHYAFLAHNRSLHRTRDLTWFTAELSHVVYDLTNMIITALQLCGWSQK